MVAKIAEMNVSESSCPEECKKGGNDIIAKRGKVGCIKREVEVPTHAELDEDLEIIQDIRRQEKPLSNTGHILDGENYAIASEFFLEILDFPKPPEEGDLHRKPIGRMKIDNPSAKYFGNFY